MLSNACFCAFDEYESAQSETRLSPAALMFKTMFEKEIGALAKACRP
jgi:hypothetical protein